MKRGLSDMWFPTTLRAGRPRTMARCRQISLAILCPLLLGGCGGGSSTTDEGFRFVPEGSGAVIPNSNVQFNYDAGSVTSGVIVTASPVTPGAAPNGTAVLQPASYQVTFSTPTITFNPQARIFLTYSPTSTPSSVTRVYLYSPVAANGIVVGWHALPVTASAPASAPSSNPNTLTLGALLPSVVESGSILAVYEDTPPPVSGVPLTVTGP